MAFMKPQIYRGDYYPVETTIGTEIVPVDVSGFAQSVYELTNYLEGQLCEYLGSDETMKPQTIERRNGWLARMSAPGYLDCTPWSVYDTEEEAQKALMEYYGEDNDE